ncbi:hypothetical protein M427DRAFT_153912 [Gonapodya prolifera JEL478]|uniref:Uncharacterized protein n=1 Tax=Gonapodya prolifera (strain JEL478) TaxID=1344416 RepID=A0A139ALK1_GONPJ|nr:hypothetical protein M427DRAFT_153912 [Gonapodya prolifera JEL478]|eukprot:KXS17434.1 hypothetical protein M427DRAFT_153912 [Gonapodya prolifera JEL478]
MTTPTASLVHYQTGALPTRQPAPPPSPTGSNSGATPSDAASMLLQDSTVSAPGSVPVAAIAGIVVACVVIVAAVVGVVVWRRRRGGAGSAGAVVGLAKPWVIKVVRNSPPSSLAAASSLSPQWATPSDGSRTLSPASGVAPASSRSSLNSTDSGENLIPAGMNITPSAPTLTVTTTTALSAAAPRISPLFRLSSSGFDVISGSWSPPHSQHNYPPWMFTSTPTSPAGVEGAAEKREVSQLPDLSGGENGVLSRGGESPDFVRFSSQKRRKVPDPAAPRKSVSR